jgi:hypothetical protein
MPNIVLGMLARRVCSLFERAELPKKTIDNEKNEEKRNETAILEV